MYKRQGADGCIATNRITVEGYKVGYCYRANPAGGWDSGDVYKRQPLEVPPQYKLVGTLPPFTDQPCRSYGV